MIAEHNKKADGTNNYSFGNVKIELNDNDLTCITNGFDESIGTVIASNAKVIAYNSITHYTSHRVHPTKKEVEIRLTCPDVRNVFTQAIDLAIVRSEKLLNDAMKL